MRPDPSIPDPSIPDLSIIVISYNTREETLEALRSVYRETHETTFELIVVDNASADGSAEAIAAEFPDIRLIASRENLGFGGANNLAAKEARADLLLLLNPDTVTLDGGIDKLMDFARQRPECGIWGGRTLYPDRTLNPASCWRGLTLWGLFVAALGLHNVAPDNALCNYDGYGGWKRDTVREVDTVTGCFLLIRRPLWDELGGFDPVFYMYGEEADLCLRARQRGARPTITPDAVIIHYGGLSETVPAPKIERLMRAKLTLAQKHWSGLRLWVCKLLFDAFVVIRVLGFGTVARLTSRPRARERAQVWREVWSHRHDWRKGYLG